MPWLANSVSYLCWQGILEISNQIEADSSSRGMMEVLACCDKQLLLEPKRLPTKGSDNNTYCLRVAGLPNTAHDFATLVKCSVAFAGSSPTYLSG
jgi:hypothetical protein